MCRLSVRREMSRNPTLNVVSFGNNFGNSRDRIQDGILFILDRIWGCARTGIGSFSCYGKRKMRYNLEINKGG